MEKNPASYLQEIIFGSADKAESRRVSLLVKAGKAKKIAPKIYTTNLAEDAASIIKRNWFKILSTLYPKSLLSHRSALECKPTLKGDIYLTYSYTKKIILPGLIIHLQEGSAPLDGDNSFFGELYLSQPARAFLENLEISRPRANEGSKIFTQQQLEEKLESIIRTRGEKALNEIRDKARELAPKLAMEKEFQKLDTLIGALLNTRPSSIHSSEVAISRVLGEPFDASRVYLFEKLYEALSGNNYPGFPEKNNTTKSYQNFAFFESYFSNYIEGTEFEIAEAKQIITSQTPMPARNEDSHDILGTYQIVSNKKEMTVIPQSVTQFIDLLRDRHSILLSSRTNKKPGEFKDKNNRAGNTEFVDWQLVTGTLKKGFEYYQLLQEPFARSIYMMFLVSEVHPFLDGNGRIARVMMNAELTAKGISKIIIPTVYREDYMGALRRLTRNEDTETYTRMMLRAFEFSSTIHGEDLETMQKYLESCDAFMEPKEGKLKYTPEK